MKYKAELLSSGEYFVAIKTLRNKRERRGYKFSNLHDAEQKALSLTVQYHLSKAVELLPKVNHDNPDLFDISTYIISAESEFQSVYENSPNYDQYDPKSWKC